MASLDDDAIIDRLQSYRHTGRPGWSIRTLWSAYIASFFLDLDSTNDLIRRLEDDPALRQICGFANQLPHRTTFNRFITRLGDHPGLVEQCINGITTTLQGLLPFFGTEIAIDSTAVRSHSNPDRKNKVTGLCSDPEARWGRKHSVKSKEKDSIEWFFGYKLHMISDANYELPISFQLTPGNRNDSPELRAIMDQAFADFDWFDPSVVIADRGYDSQANFKYLYDDHAIDPIIHIRRPTAHDQLYGGVYDENGLPHCLGNIPMTFVGTNGEGEYIYRCNSEGCQLQEARQGGITHCDFAFAEDPTANPALMRILGPVTRRHSPEWKALYSKRWSIERIFKSTKESCRLESHYIRGLKNITLHALMSVLTYQARALVKLLAGELGTMRWQVRKVA